MSDDAKRLRERELQATDPAGTEPGQGSTSQLVRVITTTPEVGKFFKAQPVIVTGLEVEGGGATVTDNEDAGELLVVPRDGLPNGLTLATFAGFRWVSTKGAKPCAGSVGVSLHNEATGAAISGATVKIYADNFLRPTTLISTQTTDGSGNITPVTFAISKRHRIHVEIASSFDSAVAVFDAVYAAGRACDVQHDYDFGESKYCLNVFDCIDGTPISGLHRTTYNPGGFGFRNWFDLRLGYSVACDPGTPFFSAYYYYLDRHVTGLSDGGIVGTSSYCEIFLFLVERPHTCTFDMWRWQVHNFDDYQLACDNSGKYKPFCGESPMVLGASDSQTVSIFPLGSDWTFFWGTGISDGQCSIQCSPPVNLDCSPSGLVPRTIRVTITGTDLYGCPANLVGNTYDLPCVGIGLYGGPRFSSGPISVSLAPYVFTISGFDAYGHACVCSGAVGGHICHPLALVGYSYPTGSVVFVATEVP